ncbi:MAG: Glu/Leu/Phe/Val dehydrogenase dimerization domain-containing protein, partial [Planctomycetota bacterium]
MDRGPLSTAEFEQIQVLKDPGIGFLGFIVIHDTRRGPAFGGIRRWTYGTPEEALEDCLRLAEAMTLKCAIQDIPAGGGKAVVVQQPGLDRQAGYRLLGRYVQHMAGRFYTGPDVGTEPGDLEAVASATQFVAQPGPDGPGNLGEPTALGVFAAIRALAARLGASDLGGLTIAVQGLGEVGARLARMLHEAGATLLIADVREETATSLGSELGARVVDTDEILGVPCDIYAPCAMGGVINTDSLPALRARGIAGAANNVLATPEHGDELHRRGILYAPDFVVNSGALVHGALFYLEGRPPPASRVERIGTLVGEILDRAAAEDRPPSRL